MKETEVTGENQQPVVEVVTGEVSVTGLEQRTGNRDYSSLECACSFGQTTGRCAMLDRSVYQWLKGKEIQNNKVKLSNRNESQRKNEADDNEGEEGGG